MQHLSVKFLIDRPKYCVGGIRYIEKIPGLSDGIYHRSRMLFQDMLYELRNHTMAHLFSRSVNCRKPQDGNRQIIHLFPAKRIILQSSLADCPQRTRFGTDNNIRFGIGRYTTEEEIDETIALVAAKVGKLRELSPLWEMHLEGIDLNSVQWAAH